MKNTAIDRFAETINAAFSGDESGHIYQYLYEDPRPDHMREEDKQVSLDTNIQGSPNYYIFYDGLKLLDHHKSKWAQTFGPNRTYIELGIGSATAFTKTKTLVKAFNPKSCVFNDLAPEYVKVAQSELGRWAYEKGLSTVIQGLPGDFIGTSIDWTPYENPVVVLQGCTIQNYDNIQDILRALGRIAGPKGDILVDYDTNQNFALLDKAYGSEQQIRHRLKILDYVKQIFNPEGFHPEAFYWQPEWRGRDSLLLQKLTCDAPQSFTIGRYHHKEVRSVVISKMYKYSSNDFHRHVKTSGLSVAGTFLVPNSTVVMEHLKPEMGI